MKTLTIALLTLCTSSLSAQTGAVAGIGTIYGLAKGNLIKAAEQMPEADYSEG